MMMSQSALKRGLIDPQIQKERRAKMQQMASKAYAAKVSSKQTPYTHSMYQAYHKTFWSKQDEVFINEMKSRFDALNISRTSGISGVSGISNKSSAVSSGVGFDIQLLNSDDRVNQFEQLNITKEMKKKKNDFGYEPKLQSEIKMINKNKVEIKIDNESKMRQEKNQRQQKQKREEQLRKIQKEKQIKLAKQKQQIQEIRKKKIQQQEKINQINRQEQIKKQKQAQQINEKNLIQKKKLKQMEELQNMKKSQIKISKQLQQKLLLGNELREQKQQQQENQQIQQQQCGPSYYELLSNASKVKIKQISKINNPATHSSMIINSEKREQVSFLSQIKNKDNKQEIVVPSSSKEENLNGSKGSHQNKGNLVQSNHSSKTQENRKIMNNLSLSQSSSQKKIEDVGLEKSIKLDEIPTVQQEILKQLKVQELEAIAPDMSLQAINQNPLQIELQQPSNYLDMKVDNSNQLNQRKNTSSILAQLNQQPKRQNFTQKNVDSQIVEPFQDKPKLQSSYSLQQLRIDSHTIDHLNRPSLKIVEQQKQKKENNQQRISEQDNNPSILNTQQVQEQPVSCQSYDKSQANNADTVQQINTEERVEALIYDLLLDIDEKSSVCPQCSSYLKKQSELIKKIEELELRNKELINEQEEAVKKARQNTINLETRILVLENQKQMLAQKLEAESFYLVNPGGKGQKRKNSQSCLPQRNTQSKKVYNSEQQSGKNSSDQQENKQGSSKSSKQKKSQKSSQNS